MKVRRSVTLWLFACLVVACWHGAARGQQVSAVAGVSERERGIELYKAGNVKGAIAALKTATKQSKTDADAWYYLGVALNDDKKPKDARKAFERAAKLRPDFTAARVGVAYSLLLSNKLKDARKAATGLLNANPNSVEARYMLGLINLRLGSPSRALDEVSEALKINPDYAPTLYVKSLALLHLYAEPFTGPMTEFHKTRRPYLSLAAETLEKLLAVAPKSPDAPFWREQLETVRVHARIGDEDNASRTFFTARDVDTKAILLYRPEPGFTTEARKNGVTGVVRLRLVLAADGTIKHILVLQSLPDGLTEAAIAAARSIKFTPATKNGQPVSQVVTVEYNFNIY